MVEPRRDQAAEEGGGAVVKEWQVLVEGAFGCRPVIVIPAMREWMV